MAESYFDFCGGACGAHFRKQFLSKGGDFFVVVRTREQNHTQGSGEGIPMKRLKRGAKICYITN